MDRRQALKTMGAAALAQLSTNELFAMARETHSQLQEVTDTDRYILKSLDPRPHLAADYLWDSDARSI